MGNNRHLTLDAQGTLSISKNINIGDKNLTKTGSGTLTLSGTNTYTGDTVISNGTLTVSATGTLAATTDVSVASGAVYDVDSTDTIQSLSGAGDVQIATGVTLTFGDASSYTLSVDISGTGSILKQGAGVQSLSGTNTYTGDTTISDGTLKLTGGLDEATDLIIGSNGTLDLQAAQTFATLTLNGAISNTAGTSSLVISGAASMQGTAATTGTQTYSGAVTLTDTTTITTSSAKVTFAAAATIS